MVDGQSDQIAAALEMLPEELAAPAREALAPVSQGPEGSRRIGALAHHPPDAAALEQSTTLLREAVDRLEDAFAREGIYPSQLPEGWGDPGWEYRTVGEDFELVHQGPQFGWRYSSLEGFSLRVPERTPAVVAAVLVPSARPWDLFRRSPAYTVAETYQEEKVGQLRRELGESADPVRLVLRPEMLVPHLPDPLGPALRQFRQLEVALDPGRERVTLRGYGSGIAAPEESTDCSEWLGRLPGEARTAVSFEPSFPRALGLAPFLSDGRLAAGADLELEPENWRRQAGQILTGRIPVYVLSPEGETPAAGWATRDLPGCRALSLGETDWTAAGDPALPEELPGLPLAAGRLSIRRAGELQRWAWAAGADAGHVWWVAERLACSPVLADSTPCIRPAVETTHRRETTVRAAESRAATSAAAAPRPPGRAPSRSCGSVARSQG
ncbi:MAG: hypothetical protein HY319_02290 [Armatimonadetes bacterium]|nr:hypothetical protein [Armatimonadota bacterium]